MAFHAHGILPIYCILYIIPTPNRLKLMFFVRDKIIQNKLEVQYIPTSELVVDIMNKILCRTQFNHLYSKPNLTKFT